MTYSEIDEIIKIAEEQICKDQRLVERNANREIEKIKARTQGYIDATEDCIKVYSDILKTL